MRREEEERGSIREVATPLRHPGEPIQAIKELREGAWIASSVHLASPSFSCIPHRRLSQGVPTLSPWEVKDPLNWRGESPIMLLSVESQLCATTRDSSTCVSRSLHFPSNSFVLNIHTVYHAPPFPSSPPPLHDRCLFAVYMILVLSDFFLSPSRRPVSRFS